MDSGISRRRHDPRCVIAIDDDFTQAFLERQLIRYDPGIEIHVASDGIEALELIETAQPDLLFLDVELPRLSGLELLELVRSDKSQRHLQILIITGIGLEETVKKAIEMGVDDYILRPFRGSVVEERVGAALAKTRLRIRDAASQRELPLLVVADSDPNFAETVSSALHGQFDVQIAPDSGKLLSAALRDKPEGILLDPDLPGMDAWILASRLVVIRPNVRLIFATNDSDPPRPEPPAHGYVTRSYVPEKLLSACRLAFADQGAAQVATPAWLEPLSPHIATAMRQTFGVMTGTNLDLAQDLSTPHGLVSRLCLSSDHSKATVEISVVALEDVCRKLVARMLAVAPDDVDQEDVHAGVNELVNVVAGRIKQDSDEHGWQLRMGLPEHITVSSSEFHAERYDYAQRFLWNEQDSIWILVKLNPEYVL